MINLASLLLGGAGLFTVLTGFNVPETTSSFWGENPFAIKRDAIETAMDWIFSSVALVALLLQAYAEILGDELPQYLHSRRFYVWFAGGALIAVVALVWLLSAGGRAIARRWWISRVIRDQGNLFQRAESVIRNDGFPDEELPATQGYTPEKRGERRVANFTDAERNIRQVEKLFELKTSGDLGERAARVRTHLDQLRPRYPARPMR
jgi:hypothetical protein